MANPKNREAPSSRVSAGGGAVTIAILCPLIVCAVAFAAWCAFESLDDR
jgi:hypothetical protein